MDYYDEYDYEPSPPETKKERKDRKRKEKRDAVIREVIGTLRDPVNNVIGTCHGCTNVLNDAANFLSHHYGVGGGENARADRGHPVTTVIETAGPVGPGANAVSVVDEDGIPHLKMITYVSPDGRTLHVLG